MWFLSPCVLASLFSICPLITTGAEEPRVDRAAGGIWLSPKAPAHRGQLRQGLIPAVLANSPHQPGVSADVSIIALLRGLMHQDGHLGLGAA